MHCMVAEINIKELDELTERLERLENQLFSITSKF